jgi:thiol-disulfide isomerase/thioredoxin
MSSRLAIVAGLLAGILTAIIAGALVVAFGPDVPLVQLSSPPAALATPAGSATPSSRTPSAGATASASTSAPSPSPGGPAFHVGQAAPPLLVRQLGGGTIGLAALRGRPVWIEFMATWCPSCRDEFPLMSGYAARFADRGLVVLAVDVREDEGTVAAFANQLRPTFPMGLDEDGTAASAWDVVALPTHFFVDAAGIVRDGAVGEIGPDVMASALGTIMPGVTITP